VFFLLKFSSYFDICSFRVISLLLLYLVINWQVLPLVIKGDHTVEVAVIHWVTSLFGLVFRWV